MKVATKTMAKLVGVALVMGAFLAGSSSALAEKDLCRSQVVLVNKLGRAFKVVSVTLAFKKFSRKQTFNKRLGADNMVRTTFLAGRHKNGCKGKHKFTIQASCLVDGKTITKTLEAKKTLNKKSQSKRSFVYIGTGKQKWPECK